MTSIHSPHLPSTTEPVIDTLGPRTRNQDEIIETDDLPSRLRTFDATDTHRFNLKLAVEELEYSLLVKALERHHGIKAAAARALGLTERIMGLRVAKYNIDVDRYKSFGRRGRLSQRTSGPALP